MAGSFVSRHFLECQADKVRWLPFFPPAGSPDADGCSAAHKPLLVAAYDPPSGATRLCVANLALRLSADDGQPLDAAAALSWHASWDHSSGRVSALHARALGGPGEVGVAVGSTSGGLSRLLLRAPTTPGAAADGVMEAAGSGGLLTLAPGAAAAGAGSRANCASAPAYLHRGPLTDLDVCPGTHAVATVGLDGRICLLHLLASAAAAPDVLVDQQGDEAFTCVRWTSPDVLLTAGSTPGLQLWDRRQPRRPVGAHAPEGGHKSLLRGISCLDVLLTRPHLCASGGPAGGVTLWDLRRLSDPAGMSPMAAGTGRVHEVRFDPYDRASYGAVAAPRILAATEAGELMHAYPAGPHGGVKGASGARPLLPREAAAITTFDVDAAAGEDLVCATEHECLAYARRADGVTGPAF